MAQQPQTLLVDDDGGVRRITLNRPGSLNAVNYDVLRELEDVLADSHHDPDVRVLVLSGAGRAFCAGDDLKGMGTPATPLPEDPARRAELGYPRFVLALRRTAKPVIAHVHGFALGAGCDLALACDLVFATDDATFGMVFAQRGMVSGTGLLPSLVGYHKACELLFSGDTFSARQAADLGLVNATGPAAEISEVVDGWAARLAAGPTSAVGAMKTAINRGIGAGLEQAVDIQRCAVALSYGTDDYEEGRRAFVDKRPPRFTGR